MRSVVESPVVRQGALAVRQALCVQFVKMGISPSAEMWERAGLHSLALRRELLEAEFGGQVVAAAVAGRSADRRPLEL